MRLSRFPLLSRLAQQIPPIEHLVAERDQWHTEAVARRRQAASLRRRLDRVSAASTTDRAAAEATAQAWAAEAARYEAVLGETHAQLVAADGRRSSLDGELTAAADRERVLERELAAARAHYAWLRREVGAWLPGHYYSPVPDWKEVRDRSAEIFAIPDSIPGIDFRAADQLARLAEFAGYYAEHTFPVKAAAGHRYCLENRTYGWADGLVYYCMLRSLRPARVVEVGSGWSSALLLDVDEEFLGTTTRTTFIEPFTERLDSLLRDTDRDQRTIIEKPLWQVGPEPFDALEPGDVLFIDSTHVSKIGSDVNRLVLDILPGLPAGVHVHVHDIFYPFEYPKYWIEDGRAWNEAYLLRAYLTDNPTIRITWANSYLHTFHRDEVAAAMPQWNHGPGGALWLETLPAPGRRSRA